MAKALEEDFQTQTAFALSDIDAESDAARSLSLFNIIRITLYNT
jgi:hypothetical protein